MDKLTIINNDLSDLTPDIEALLETIKFEITQGQERAKLAMEQEKRQIYWNIGKHIKTNLLKNAKRSDYGEYLFKILAKNLSIDVPSLHRSVKFYEEYPQIVDARPQLTWNHIKTLLTISDKAERQEYEEQIVTEQLSYRELKELVNGAKKGRIITGEDQQLARERGVPFTYRLKEVQNRVLIDLGFRVYTQGDLRGFSKDEIIEAKKEGKKYKILSKHDSTLPHYIYKAYLVEVIDGDTLWVDIDLGFDVWSTQKLRFRGINTQEVATKSGKTAKEFIEGKLKHCPFIAVKTYWGDKFTRYLADIFYNKKETDFSNLISNGKFLNQELLDKKLAVIY